MNDKRPAAPFWRNAAFGLFLGALSWAGPSQAVTLFSAVNGAEMGGMEVTVSFLGGGSETAIWTATSATGGGATGTGWSLAQQDDTFPGPNAIGAWTLSNGNAGTIGSLAINALAGNVVFDITLGDPNFTGTPGSSFGFDFFADPSSPFQPTSAVYGNLFNAPDLFGTLTLTWANGFASGSRLLFVADTDRVPEPPVLALLAIGLLGAASARRLGRGAPARSGGEG
jgi:hypothetical protein